MFFPLIILSQLHFVSYNTKYDNLVQAIDQADGLAVLGLFIQVTRISRLAYSSFIHSGGLSQTSRLAAQSALLTSMQADISPVDAAPAPVIRLSMNVDTGRLRRWPVVAVDLSFVSLNLLLQRLNEMANCL